MTQPNNRTPEQRIQEQINRLTVELEERDDVIPEIFWDGVFAKRREHNREYATALRRYHNKTIDQVSMDMQLPRSSVGDIVLGKTKNEKFQTFVDFYGHPDVPYPPSIELQLAGYAEVVRFLQRVTAHPVRTHFDAEASLYTHVASSKERLLVILEVNASQELQAVCDVVRAETAALSREPLLLPEDALPLLLKDWLLPFTVVKGYLTWTERIR